VQRLSLHSSILHDAIYRSESFSAGGWWAPLDNPVGDSQSEATDSARSEDMTVADGFKGADAAHERAKFFELHKKLEEARESRENGHIFSDKDLSALLQWSDPDRIGWVAFIDRCEKFGVLPKPLFSGKEASLSLHHYGLSTEIISALAEQIRVSSSLRSIDLDANRMQPAAIQTITEAIAANGRVCELHIANNAIGRVPVIHLATLLEASTTLTILDISGNKIGDGGMLVLQKALKRNEILETLRIARNELGSKGGQYVAEVIRQAVSLRELNCSWNAVGQEGGISIAKALRSNEGLVKLDTSWNGIDDAASHELAMALREHGSLEIVDLSHNRLGPQAGVAIGRALEDNTVLDELCMDYNPIGAAGMISLVRLMLHQIPEQTFRGNVTCNGCTTKLHRAPDEKSSEQKYDRFKPEGNYTLQLSNGYDYAVARDLLDLARFEKCINWKLATLNDRRWRVDPSDRDRCEIPDHGTLLLEITEQTRRYRPIDKSDFDVDVLPRYMNPAHSDNTRLFAVQTLTQIFRFTCKQAKQLVVMIGNKYVKQAAVQALYPRLLDSLNIDTLLQVLTPDENFVLFLEMGKLVRFYEMNPTGHYQLDLSKTPHRKIALRLLALNKEELNQQKSRQQALFARTISSVLPCPCEHCRLEDFSPTANGQLWRNVTMHGRPLEFVMDYQLPEFGQLEFDYVSMIKPDRGSKPCDVAQFHDLMKTLKDELSNDETRMLSFLKEFMSRTCLNTFQALRIMSACFPTQSCRVEFMVTIFRRLTDFQDFYNLKEQLTHDANMELARRLGFLLLFDAERPDGRYTLDLSIRDQRCLLSCLLHLAGGHRVHFNNWKFNDEPHQIPRSWFSDYTDIPSIGIADFTYTSEVDGGIRVGAPTAAGAFQETQAVVTNFAESSQRQSVKQMVQQRRTKQDPAVRKSVSIEALPLKHTGSSSAHHRVG
jgi:hypothetical protein